MLKRISQFGFIKSLAGVNCKNCNFSANMSFLQKMYKVKKNYKMFARKTVSYINYIINKGVVPYPGNRSQTLVRVEVVTIDRTRD